MQHQVNATRAPKRARWNKGKLTGQNHRCTPKGSPAQIRSALHLDNGPLRLRIACPFCANRYQN